MGASVFVSAIDCFTSEVGASVVFSATDGVVSEVLSVGTSVVVSE